MPTKLMTIQVFLLWLALAQLGLPADRRRYLLCLLSGLGVAMALLRHFM